MRQILRQRELTVDRWRYPEEAGEGPRVLALAELQALPGSGPAAAVGAAGLGVLLGPTDDVELLRPYLSRLALVVVHFEKDGDGRGFTQAQLLRLRVNFSGELRARGAIKRDHVFLLARCGFDAFDLDPAEDRQAALAQLGRFSVAFQDAADTLVHPRRRA